MEQLNATLATLVGKLQEAGFEQAPEVVAGAIRAIHWDGLLNLSFVIFFVLTMVVSVWWLIQGSINKSPGTQMQGLVGSLVSLILVILWSSDNPWLKVFDPQAALYQRILEGIF